MTPIDQRRDAGIESFQSAQKIAGVSVFSAVKTADRAVQTAQIVGESPVRSDVAKQGLPGVAMRVDHSGQHQAVGGIDNLRVGPRVDLRRHLRDPAVFDQEITLGEIADGRVDGDDRSVLDKRKFGHEPSDKAAS